MVYTINDVEKIKSFKTWSPKRKIDALLELDSIQACNLGLDSTDNQLNQAKRQSRKIYRAIRAIDYKLGESFLQSMD